MRRSPKVEFIEYKSQFVGVNLTADYVAEHEWGIKDLRRMLGVDTTAAGLQSRRIQNTDDIYLQEEGDDLYLICADKYFRNDVKNVARSLHTYELRGDKFTKSKLLSGAWDGESFGVAVKDDSAKKKLRKLYDAIVKGDAAIWLGGGGVFENAGLVIGIISALPESLDQEIKDKQKADKELAEADAKTGIKEKLAAAGLGYYALSPSVNHTKKSAHPVVYWLNPYDQDRYNSGLYSVEELEDWIEKKGPVCEVCKKCQRTHFHCHCRKNKGHRYR